MRWREIGLIFVLALAMGVTLMAVRHGLAHDYDTAVQSSLVLAGGVWAVVSILNVGWTVAPANDRAARKKAACWMAGMVLSIPVTFVATYGLLHL